MKFLIEKEYKFRKFHFKTVEKESGFNILKKSTPKFIHLKNPFHQ